jgi:hypothetical protein
VNKDEQTILLDCPSTRITTAGVFSNNLHTKLAVSVRLNASPNVKGFTMTVTNGHVEFEQRVADGDFRHRVAKASISFEGEDYDIARRIAVDQVSKALGLKPDSQIITPAPVQACSIETPVSEASTSAMERRHEADVMPETDQVGGDACSLPAPKGKRGRKSDGNPFPLMPASSLNGSPGGTAPTDQMLQSACQARMERGINENDVEVAMKIRSLIASYVGEVGKKASDIVQDKRMEFLRELSL